MGRKDEPYPESPPSPSYSESKGEAQSESMTTAFSPFQLQTTPSEACPTGSLIMEDQEFSRSSSPLMDFEAFSSVDPSSYLPVFEFKANPLTKPAPIAPSCTGGGEAENFGVPQALECLQGNPIPPFLSKTFDLVDDRSLDPIISWGATGESFVVWDPVEFARLVLPKNFKHNNFSSFVRQLNTYGFRKIDADRWEFSNEAFRRGKRHLLKNIQRRKSPQSLQIGAYIGPPTETGRSGMEGEIEKLRKQRSALMQEVVELKQQQHGTASYMEAVNQRLQGAEQKQRQMVSFLAKLFRNPTFLARLQQKKEQRDICSSMTRRKFAKHQQNEQGQSDSPMEGHIVKYTADRRNLIMFPTVPDVNPVPVEQPPDYPFQSMARQLGSGPESLPLHSDFASHELVVADEQATVHGFIKSPEQVGEETASLGTEDPLLRGKEVMSPRNMASPEYFISFPDDLAQEKKTPEFSSPGIESIAYQEDIWSMGFDTSAGMSSSSSELWSNVINYDVPDFGVTGGLSDIWNFGSLQVNGSSGIDKWPADESPFEEPRNQAGEPKDDTSRNMVP